jgi:hypothetical protein
VIPSDRQIHARFYVGGSDGITWHDLTDHLISADVDVGDVAQLGASGVDGVVRQADFTLWRRGTSYTLSNHRTGYPWSHYADDTWNVLSDRTWEVLNTGHEVLLLPNREVVLQVAITTPGGTPTAWRTLFHGLMGDSISYGDTIVTLSCRDMAKRLHECYIEEVQQYGSEEGTPLEAVIQQILDDNLGAGAVPLHCPVSPGFMVTPYEVEHQSVWDAVQKAVAQIGWFIGYRWDPTIDEFRLTLMEPPRDKDASTADFTLDYEDDIYIEDLEISDKDIRNAVRVTYRDAATGQRKYVTATNSTSIAEYGRRAMQIEEADTSLIDTEAEALRLANAAIADLSQLTSTDRITMPLLPEIDVFSGIVVNNPRTLEGEGFYAVESVRHTIDYGGNRFRTEAIASGKVIGAHTRWLEMQTRPGSPGEPDHPTPITDITPGAVQWGLCEFETQVILRWYPVRDAAAYEIRTDEDWGNPAGMVYRGQATSFTFHPAQREYTFYLRAINGAGNYSTVTATKTLSNPAPSKPPTPVVTEFFSRLWIDIKAVTDTDILGYNVYITPCDEFGTPTGMTEVAAYSTPQRVTYNAEPGSSFLIQTAAYDALGEGEKSDTVQGTTTFLGEPDIPEGIVGETKLSQALVTKIDTAKLTAEDAQERVGAAEGRLEGVEGRVTTTETSVGQLEGEIALKASADELDAVEGRVTTVEGQLSIQAGLIESKAEKSEVTALDGRIETAESTISQHADKIEQKVEQTEFDELGQVVSSTASQVTQLGNEYTVKMQGEDAEGNPIATGFGLAVDDQNITEFGVLANRFKIYGTTEGGTAQAVFAVDTQTSKVYLLGDLIADGSITSRMVGANQIITEKGNIKEAIIDTAHIDSIEASKITVGGKPHGMAIAMPQGAHLFHFDGTLMSTQGLEPTTATASIADGGGRFGSAVAVAGQLKYPVTGRTVAVQRDETTWNDYAGKTWAQLDAM